MAVERAFDVEAADSEKLSRLTVTLRSEEIEALKRLASERGVSLTDVLRRALAYYKLADENERAGGTLLLKGPDNALREVRAVR
jgi:hypothetical protein